jgi:hypothetical protein
MGVMVTGAPFQLGAWPRSEKASTALLARFLRVFGALSVFTV